MGVMSARQRRRSGCSGRGCNTGCANTVYGTERGHPVRAERTAAASISAGPGDGALIDDGVRNWPLWPLRSAQIKIVPASAVFDPSQRTSFPTEEANSKDRAECGNSKHGSNLQQDAPCADAQECILHHRKSLCQRENADDFLHRLWHDLDRQRCAGKDQHGEIVVLFPAPFAPSSPNTVPLFTERSR